MIYRKIVTNLLRICHILVANTQSYCVQKKTAGFVIELLQDFY